MFYDGKNLHADRRILHECFPSRLSDDGTKLFVNERNDIAIGVCGVLPDEEEKKKIFSVAEVIFLMMYKREFSEKIDFWPMIEKTSIKYKDNQFIGMTKDKTFLYKEGWLFSQTGGYMCALGTGHRSIIGCYYVVRDVKLAFRLSSEIDTLSSPEYMSVMVDTLVPYHWSE